jgi:hypothetical protein
MRSVLRLADINRAVSRRRRWVALLGAMIVLGVVALDVHGAMCDCCHDDHGKAALCMAAEAIATLAALGWCRRRAPCATTRVGRTLPHLTERLFATERTTRARARAGPVELAVLRL